MPGDPKQCRQPALNCMVLAKRAITEESKQTFHNLAQSWTRPAVELEGAQALLTGLNVMESKDAPSDQAEQHEQTSLTLSKQRVGSLAMLLAMRRAPSLKQHLAAIAIMFDFVKSQPVVQEHHRRYQH